MSDPNASLEDSAARIKKVADGLQDWWQGDENHTTNNGAVDLPSPANLAKQAATVLAAVNLARDDALEQAGVATSAAGNAQSKARSASNWAQLATWTPSQIGEGAEVLDADSGTHIDPSTSATVPNAGAYQGYATTLGAWTRIGGTGLSGKASVDDLNALSKRTDDIEISFSETAQHPAFSRDGDSLTFSGSVGYYKWCVSPTPLAFDALGYLRLHVDYVNFNDKIRVEVFARPNGSVFDGPGNIGQGDVLERTLDFPTADFTNTQDWQDISLIGDFSVPDGYFPLLHIAGLLSDNSAGRLGIWRDSTTSGLTQSQRGFYALRTTPSTISNISGTSAVAISVGRIIPALPSYALSADLAAAQVQIQANTHNADMLLATTVASQELVSSFWPANGSFYNGSFPFGRWAWGVREAELRYVEILTDQVNFNDHYEIRLWARDLSPSYTGAPIESGGDVVVYGPVNFPASAFPQTAEQQVVTFDLGRQVAPSGKMLIVDIKAITAASTMGRIGMGRYDGATTLDQSERGYYQTSNPAAWSSIAAGSAFPTVARRVYAEAVAIDGTKIVGLTLPAADASNYLIDALEPTTSLSGLVVTLGGRSIKMGVESPINASVTLTAAAAGTETKTVNLRPLSESSAIWASNLNTYLDRRHISNVSATRVSNGAALVLNTDFTFDVNGKLRGLIETAAYSVNVTYDYARSRYDLICFNEQTDAWSVVQGTERDFDAYEYMPAFPSNLRVAYVARIVGGEATLFPAHEFRQGMKTACRPDYDECARRVRAAMPKLFRKLQRGEDVTIAMYSDSIGAIQNLTGIGGMPYTPNGVNRDRPETYFQHYPSDFVAAIPKYTGLELFGVDDGAGQVHVKISFIWKLIDALAAKYGVAVHYLNFGIAGTTTATTEHNGRWPARLAELTSSTADAVFYEFGMNQLGQAGIEADLVAIAAAAAAADKESCFFTVPRINTPQFNNVTGWRLTNLLIDRAARTAGAGLIPLHWISEDYGLGGLNIAPDDRCLAGLYNHPGLLEHLLYGRLAAEFF